MIEVVLPKILAARIRSFTNLANKPAIPLNMSEVLMRHLCMLQAMMSLHIMFLRRCVIADLTLEELLYQDGNSIFEGFNMGELFLMMFGLYLDGSCSWLDYVCDFQYGIDLAAFLAGWRWFYCLLLSNIQC